MDESSDSLGGVAVDGLEVVVLYFGKPNCYDFGFR